MRAKKFGNLKKDLWISSKGPATSERKPRPEAFESETRNGPT
jgi:hypothetical protein